MSHTHDLYMYMYVYTSSTPVYIWEAAGRGPTVQTTITPSCLPRPVTPLTPGINRQHPALSPGRACGTAYTTNYHPASF